MAADEGLPYDATISLRHGERVLNIELHPFVRPTRAPSPAAELCKLTGVHRLEDVGKNGPSMASRASDGNAADSSRRLFEVLFGRDSLTVASFAGPYLPTNHSAPSPAATERIWADRLTDSTVLRLAELQGLPAEHAPAAEQYTARREEAGRIVHEVRDPVVDPIAQQLTREEGWGWPMYGSDDATPLFAVATLRMAAHDPSALDIPITQRDGVTRSLGECLANALHWIEHDRLGPEGLFETKQAGAVFVNGEWQGFGPYPGWADSWDHLSDRDGRLPTGPVALVEIQALVYDAFRQAARFVGRHPERGDQLGMTSVTLAHEAARLRRGTFDHLLVHDERGRFFAAGAERRDDGTFWPLATRTSNMGHLLDSELLVGHEAMVRSLIDQLFDPEAGLLCPAGIRTLEKDAVRFRPGGYHTGQVWLWDNLKIARGLDRHGYHALAWELKARVVAVCSEFNLLPEFVRGGDERTPQVNQRVVDIATTGPDGNPKVNRIEQPPQDIQAWTVAGMVEVNAQLTAIRERRPGALPVRGVDPLVQAFEASTLAKVQRTQQLASAMLLPQVIGRWQVVDDLQG